MLYSDNPKTKDGIDKLELMVRFIGVLDANNLANEYDDFKSWLNSNLNRKMTNIEEINLAKGILRYIKSDEETNERLEAMEYLFNTDFLN